MNARPKLQRLEVELIVRNAAKFIDAIATARASHTDVVPMTMQAFTGEPELLYVAEGWLAEQPLGLDAV